MNATLSYPAINGEVVTERDARICAEQGHSTHTVDGVDTGRCPRCGEITVEVEVPSGPVAVFDRMLELEREVQHSTNLAAMGADLETRGRGLDNLQRARKELDGLWAELSLHELAAYGEYRKR